MQLIEKAFGRPALAHEQVFQARALAAFAQSLLIAEDLGDAAHDTHRLIGPDKRIEPHGKMRLVRKPSAHAQRVAHFAVAH